MSVSPRSGRRTEGVNVEGWHVGWSKSGILGSERLGEWSKELGFKSMPEMVFENNLTFSHTASGVAIMFDTKEALKQVLRNDESDQKVKVEAAVAWKDKHTQYGSGISTMHYGYDWTFSTDYTGTILKDGEDIRLSHLGQPKGSAALPISHAKHHIDVSKLMARDPITHYDELILFEDELHDHGLSVLSAKFRIMPRFFFALVRFFLRVDGVLIRIFDTRLYHEFGSDWIIREIKHREDSIEHIIRANPGKDIMCASDPAEWAESVKLVYENNQVIPLKDFTVEQAETL